MTITNREEWLQQAAEFILAEKLAPLTTDYPTPQVAVSVGFPSNRTNNKMLASCWTKEAGNGEVNQIFVSPQSDDSIEILAALVHELIHATDNCQSGHRGFFARVAREVGLEGKLTATEASAELTEYLQGIIDILGKIPHDKLNIGARKKQTTRMVKVECEDCSAVFRLSRKWSEQVIQCPCCTSTALIIDGEILNR